MGWNIYWLIIAIIAIVVAIYNLVVVAFSKESNIESCMCRISLSMLLGMIAVVQEIFKVSEWVTFGELAGLGERLSNLKYMNIAVVIIIGGINLISIFFCVKNKKSD